MASNSNSVLIKLQKALNQKGQHILYSTSQFYSEDQKRAVTKHTIKQAILTDRKQRYETEVLFSSYSQLQVVLYLRDLWYQVNGWELPNDNPIWEKIKKEQGLFQYSAEHKEN